VADLAPQVLQTLSDTTVMVVLPNGLEVPHFLATGERLPASLAPVPDFNGMLMLEEENLDAG
jgi:hypothetical protein